MWKLLALMALSNQQKNNYDSNRPLNENEHKILEIIASVIGIWFKLIIVTTLILATASVVKFYGFLALMFILAGFFVFRLYLFRKSLKPADVLVHQTNKMQYFVLTYAFIIQTLFEFLRNGNVGLFMRNWLDVENLLTALFKVSVEYVYTIPYFIVILLILPPLEYAYRRFIRKNAEDFYVRYATWQTNLLLLWGVYSFVRIFLFAFMFR